MRNILKPGQYFDYEHGFVDSLFTDEQMESLHACFAVDATWNGRQLDLGVGRKNEPLSYEMFREAMDNLSYGGKGYDSQLVIDQCL